ncbi:hypothetical protein ACOSP7_032612 [Xanthoceras sorbifolium]
MSETIHHASHPHELELKSYNKPYLCDGCKEIGLGTRYRCEQCNFDLHIPCSSLSANETTSHDFFHNSTLKLFFKPPGRGERFCVACVKPVRGFVYHCEEKGRDLHPCCLTLPHMVKVDDVEFKLSDKFLSSKCSWCNMKCLQDNSPGLRGWSYVSTCKKYNLHARCATEMMLQVWKKKGDNWGNDWEQYVQGLLEQTIQSVLERDRRRNIVMMFVISNVVLELLSAVVDQISSVNKPKCALFGMVISFVAMLTCILELIYEGQKEKLIWRWRRGTLPLPWFYYQHGERKPFGTFKDIVGLVCALCQCVVATVKYCYLHRGHADSPIKISVSSIIFAFGILLSQILKNRVRRDRLLKMRCLYLYEGIIIIKYLYFSCDLLR